MMADGCVQLTVGWLDDPGYQSWQICTGFAIGVVSAFLCLMVLICIGICKQFFSRIRTLCKFNHFLKEVVPPTIGGVIIGTLSCFWTSVETAPLTHFSFEQALSTGRCPLLWATAT